MATWSVNVYPLNSGTADATGVPVQDWSFSFVLNGPGGFEARLPLRNATVTKALFAEGEKEIRVYRDAVLVWGGYLWGVRVEGRDSVTIRGLGYLSRLRRRFVMSDLIYTDIAQQTIAWNLIAHTQGLSGGDLLVTQGAHAGSSVLRDADYCAVHHPNIGDEIAVFTEFDDGIDYEITPTPDSSANKTFKTYQPKKGADVSGTVVFTEDNVASWQYEDNADNVISRLVTIGNGDCNPPQDDRTDSGALAAFGLLQEFVSFDSGKISEVRAHAAHTLKNFKQSQRLVTVNYHEDAGPAWGAFVVGDLVQLTTTWGPAGGFGQLNQKMRVLSFETLLQPGNVVFHRATLDSVIT